MTDPQSGEAAQPPGPPPYGPPFGQVPFVAARKRHRGLIAALAGVGVLVVAVGLLLALDAFGGTVLDRGAAERDVAAQFEQREGVAVRLSCPARMALDTGASYRCTGTTAKGENIALHITITDDKKATYTWSEP